MLPMIIPIRNRISDYPCVVAYLTHTAAKANVRQTREKGQPPRFKLVSAFAFIPDTKRLGKLIHGLGTIEALLLKTKVELGHSNKHNAPGKG